MLSLPNGTACTAEMDQLATKKNHARYDARQNFKTTGMDDIDSSADRDIENDNEDAGGKKKPKKKVKKGHSVCNISFSN